MITGFADRETEKIWHGIISRRIPVQIQRIGRRKLRILNNVRDLDDLRVPPGNRLGVSQEGPEGAVQLPYQRPMADLLHLG